MDGDVSFLSVLVFNGDNYQAWAIRMAVHLKALDLWETVEEDYEVLPLGDNPSINQMKIHREIKTRKGLHLLCSFTFHSHQNHANGVYYSNLGVSKK